MAADACYEVLTMSLPCLGRCKRNAAGGALGLQVLPLPHLPQIAAHFFHTLMPPFLLLLPRAQLF